MTTASKTAKKAAKKTPAKKAAKKTPAKKAAKKTPAKTTASKKTPAKKAAKKTPAKKTPAKKAAKKTTTKQTTAKKTVAKKAASKAAQTAVVAQPRSATKKWSKKAAQHAARSASAAQPAPAKPAKPAKAPAPPEPVMGPGYAVLKADYRRQPGADDINRIGGLPIGFDAASWPRRKGAPMYHVLTIDLKDHPVIVPQRFRALALFISSPMKHEAYDQSNDHAVVILLTEEDLQKGVPAWPDDLDKKAALRAGRLRFESAAELTRKKLYQESFAGDEPIWLQGDESYDDYGDDGDDDDSDDDSDDEDGDDDTTPRPSVPHIFVLQFDERLIGGINLGDAGIMYVYSDSAWFQCH